MKLCAEVTSYQDRRLPFYWQVVSQGERAHSFFFPQKIKLSKNSDGVFITDELVSFMDRLSLGQEAGSRLTLSHHSCVALVGHHLSFALCETSVESAVHACQGDCGALT